MVAPGAPAAAGAPSAGHPDPATMFFELLSGMSPADIERLTLELAAPNDLASMALNELLRDEAAVAAALSALKYIMAMPDDAAARWGAPVAQHRCAKRDGNCMAKLGRESPALLDEWHARLRAAKDAAARAAALDNAVRERPGAKRQRLGGGASASLSALAMQVQGAAAATATPETEAEAAAAVRRLMNEQGCCAGAENAFLHGFVGRSNDFMYKDLKSGASMPECMMKSTVCSSSCKHSSQCTKWCGSWLKLSYAIRKCVSSFCTCVTWARAHTGPAKVVQNKKTRTYRPPRSTPHDLNR